MAPKIAIQILGSDDVEIRTDGLRDSFCKVRAQVKNGTDRSIDELEIRVSYLTPDGRPHLSDESAHCHLTYSSVWPVLRGSAHAVTAAPLKSGEIRTFEVTIPRSVDDPTEVDLKKFGATVMSLRFAKE